MKMPSMLKRKKLNATATRRRTLGLPDGMDYEEMAEPNMKLSRALLIVLLLHIVAVAGIIAFNTIKTREAVSPGSLEPTVLATETSASPAPVTEPAAVAPNEVTKVAAQTQTNTAEKPAEHPKPATKTSGVVDSGKTYVVVKGDNPVTIARHLHVNYDALLELNQIDDPRKLQIGQKLHIPASASATTPKHSKAD
jgi:LysM repeat protein